MNDRVSVTDMVPFYDTMYKMIDEKIRTKLPPGFDAVVSWLTKEEQIYERQYLIEHPPPNISDIKDPRQIHQHVYPEVKPFSFYELY